MHAVIEKELSRSRTIIAGGSELVPRFRIMTPDGDVTIFVQLPDDEVTRAGRMQLVQDFMAVKMATSFIMASELVKPDASVAIHVTRDGMVAGLQVITRSPLTFGPVCWLDRDQIGDDLTAMLPAKVTAVTPEQVAAVEELIRYNDGLLLERP